MGIGEDVHLPGRGERVMDYQLYSIPSPRLPPTFVVRMASVPADVESVLRRAIQEVGPTRVARRPRNADDYVREALAPTRFALALLVAFAGVALLLSVVGLYASVSYTVGQRTREIGIRVARGATPKGIQTLVMADGLRLAGIGLVIGMVAAVAGTRVLAGLRYGVRPLDPATFVAMGGAGRTSRVRGGVGAGAAGGGGGGGRGDAGGVRGLGGACEAFFAFTGTGDYCSRVVTAFRRSPQLCTAISRAIHLL